MSQRSFEEFIAEIFSGFGYLIELAAKTRNGRRDIIAFRNDFDIHSKIIVECHHKKANSMLDISFVRELYSVKLLDRATKAILATTALFSKEARDLERQLLYELELKDYIAITNWAKEYAKIFNST